MRQSNKFHSRPVAERGRVNRPLTLTHLYQPVLAALLWCCTLAACGDETMDSPPTNQEPEVDASTLGDATPTDSLDDGDAQQNEPITPIAPSLQREGDPELGYQVLVNDPYVSCGVPARIFDQFFGSGSPASRLPGRNELNENRRYFETAFVTESGVEVVGSNCLQCHAEYLDGQVYVGLGDTTFDYTRDTYGPAEALKLLVQDQEDERAIVDKWAQRVQTIAPYVKTRTIGVNPADSLTEVLLAHRDRETLAWSEEPLLELDEPYAIPVSVPPWWFMKKKNAMFYTGSGRGDHARFMMSASTLCTDTVEEARQIDEKFPHVRAFIESIEPPPYPRQIDESEAMSGRELFNSYCAGCHGTYGMNESYPNLIVDVSYVGTDPMLSESAFNKKLEFFDWYNESFYGEVAIAVPTSGYVAPPLDGVWATAPYFHNGSVPTLLGVIKPEARPQFWSRDFSEYLINEDHGGLIYVDEPTGHSELLSAAARAPVYDTSLRGYGNMGHEFGASLTEAEALLIVEYLKTL